MELTDQLLSFLLKGNAILCPVANNKGCAATWCEFLQWIDCFSLCCVQFNEDTLPATLDAFGIDDVQLPEFGGLRSAQKREDHSS
jgi:hypothetical protein